MERTTPRAGFRPLCLRTCYTYNIMYYCGFVNRICKTSTQGLPLQCNCQNQDARSCMACCHNPLCKRYDRCNILGMVFSVALTDRVYTSHKSSLSIAPLTSSRNLRMSAHSARYLHFRQLPGIEQSLNAALQSW